VGITTRCGLALPARDHQGALPAGLLDIGARDLIPNEPRHRHDERAGVGGETGDREFAAAA